MSLPEPHQTSNGTFGSEHTRNTRRGSSTLRLNSAPPPIIFQLDQSRWRLAVIEVEWIERQETFYFVLNMQALFEKDERLIFKRFEKICLLSKQISMKTSLWDFSSLFKINKSRNGTFNFVPTTPTLFALRVLFVLEVSSLVPFIFLVQVRVGGNSSIF